MTTSSGKHLEDIDHTQIASLLCELITSSKDSDVLSIGFDRNGYKNGEQLTNNKNQKGKNHIRLMPRDAFDLLNTKEKQVTN